MKITKARLLQIIREEVELHQKKLEENTFVFEEEDLQAAITDNPLPTNKQGDISNENAEDVLNHASQGKMEESDVEEDRIFGPKNKEGKRPIVQPKNGGKLEIKIK